MSELGGEKKSRACRFKAGLVCVGLAMLIILAAPSLFAGEIGVTPHEATTHADGGVVLQVAVEHVSGADAIKTVAASVSGASTAATFPTMYDDGTHGDSVSGDGLYSLTVVLPSGGGEHSVTYYVVDQSGAEVLSEPMSFTVE